MVYCSYCGASNREGSNFCNQCGGPLGSGGQHCPLCGYDNPLLGSYCHQCGAQLPQGAKQQPSIPRGEAAPISVLEEPEEAELPSLEAELTPLASLEGDADLLEGPDGLPRWLYLEEEGMPVPGES